MKKILKSILLPVARNIVVQHLLFWVLSGYVLLNIFSGSSSFQKIDFIYTAIFMITLAVPVELNLLVLVPNLLNRKKYGLYGFAFIVNLIFFSYFNQITFDSLIDKVLPGYYFISYYTFGDILKFFFVFLAITTLLHLSKEWFELNETRQRMVLLEKEKADAELKALSNQVNPHFLFNSLNVLYSLAMNNRKEAPEAILKLSDIMRYVIYDSVTAEVTLQSEIRVINDFIDLQRFRTMKGTQINFNTNVTNDQLTVAPMLFLPLVENSFKHGIKGDIENTFVEIELTANDDSVHFCVENNKGSSEQTEKGRSGGVGLKNIKNRLELIYPEKHKFDVAASENTFKVTLEINLKK